MGMITALISLTVSSLLALGCLPSGWLNRGPRFTRQLVTWLVGIECLLALGLAVDVGFLGEPTGSRVLIEGWQEAGISVGLYVDGASSLMLLLVSFVGLVASRYSIRYLDGEARQGRYFRWLGFTIGAVSLMVIAGNLLLFFAAWVMTSFGLHQLLLHYPHRPAAVRAAWTKFAISRLGDLFLIAALTLTYRTFGTFDFSSLFEQARAILETPEPTAAQSAIGWLLILGAVTKSAQFPFHTWLPETMETPTPVSALMHAGIVNAGGYLVIRMSPLITLAPSAMTTLAAIGTFTVCFAGITMMAQSSVKRALAYSTIAQMGFMMLQCGLGAFSAAMLHIIAHSLYKAHAFLGSGSVMSQAQATSGAKSPMPLGRVKLASLVGAGIVAFLAGLALPMLLGFDTAAKPGGLVLAVILCLALTTWGWQLFRLGEGRTLMAGSLGLVMLSLTYVGSYLFIQQMIEASGSVVSVSPPGSWVPLGIATAFAGLFVLHLLVVGQVRPRWLDALRVHAAAGFYVDSIYYRLLTSLKRA